jgi:hypothetical protein
METLPTRSYQTNSKISAEPADTLAVFCSDFRFQDGIRDFLDNGLQLKDKYDLLVIPGGPQTLTLVEYLPKFSWAGWKWFRFLLEKHALKRLVLIAHQDCKWYESLPFHLHTSRTPRQRQEEDLRRVHNTLEADFRGLNVELYYAGWNAEGRVTVETLQL